MNPSKQPTSITAQPGVKVPLAEHFHSLQGEGRWCGLPMHFFRFPGCTVGRPAIMTKFVQKGEFAVLPNGAEAKLCTAYDDRHFWCDTDYDRHEEKYLTDLVTETWEKDVCFTGGEPLMHEGKEWYFKLYTLLNQMVCIHVETSGTIMPQFHYGWLTVSPKKGWLPEVIAMADQVKILVDAHTQPVDVEEVLEHCSPLSNIYFSPIFDPNDFVKANFDHCMLLLKTFQKYRPQISVQVHKFLGLR